MNSPSSSIQVWDSGRLSAPLRSPTSGLRGQRWIALALLVLAGMVFAVYVAVLERDVARGDAVHGRLRDRAVAEAQCESATPAPMRASCVAVFDGGLPVAMQSVQPENDLVRTADARSVMVP